MEAACRFGNMQGSINFGRFSLVRVWIVFGRYIIHSGDCAYQYFYFFRTIFIGYVGKMRTLTSFGRLSLAGENARIDHFRTIFFGLIEESARVEHFRTVFGRGALPAGLYPLSSGNYTSTCTVFPCSTGVSRAGSTAHGSWLMASSEWQEQIKKYIRYSYRLPEAQINHLVNFVELRVGRISRLIPNR